MCESYGGYVNRETWALMRYLGSTPGLIDEASMLVSLSDTPEISLRELAESWWTVEGYLSGFGEDATYPESLARESQDIGSLYRVDWSECCTSLFAN